MIARDAQTRAEVLEGLLDKDPGAAAWVRQAAEAMGSEPTPSAVRLALARAGRILGEDAIDLDLDREHEARLRAAGIAVQPGWVRRDVGRAALVLHALARLPESAHATLVATLVRRGEIGEQTSMLRMLPLLPEPARFVDAAIDACRTNAEPVFAAIAADNPYPAAHFPDLHFDQMVLKAIFIGLPVDRIVGLADRITQTTVRMANDYAAERRAAGRSVPGDVGRIIELNEAAGV